MRKNDLPAHPASNEVPLVQQTNREGERGECDSKSEDLPREMAVFRFLGLRRLL